MERVGLTPERLTRAGAELAHEVGFDEVTISALARRFDVKVPSLYSHLKNSQDLRIRIALFALEELADRVADAVAGRAGRDALAAFADAYREYAREHPGRYAAARLRLAQETAAASAGRPARPDGPGDSAGLRVGRAGRDACGPDAGCRGSRRASGRS
ncbi:TetR/AcrR family transcriptional regulator [Micromonospora sp. NPDC049230]|uniref:TetR/AcrR family transcriptional regulator n=1 Tax=Micromonospora sp. NPDC049230 TaxID=3155502 RepID=UPI0033F1BB14